ncbi:hypothetical protein F1C15_01215 [Frigoribacterium sp. NBH87]|uniref:hypothetical protein n=1 Tax=Frigoribacterium sp. NBH87 TaxID=2596916 RepID=UPI00162394BB|nr:hypothetical protein [Frigoribacterium sp. NBH87]QNE42631.1 hypothetical protein F1C15_01215 [Frigoribacterium sp. NBH87]
MTDSVRTAEGDTIVVPEADDAPQRHRSTFVEPVPRTSPEAEATAPPEATDQELRPVTPTLTPEAPADLEQSPVDPEPSPADLDPTAVVEPSAPVREPRPVSVPSHRADVPADVVPTDAAEPRPASVARHSLDTSSITLPVFAEPVDPSLPQPPERISLDDDVLVRMVERRLDDTATVDLMAVVQAQMEARRQEAARFARWADEVGRIGTDEAAEALERTRLRFTGVIDVVLPLTLAPRDEVAVAPEVSSEAAEPAVLDVAPAPEGPQVVGEAPAGSPAPVTTAAAEVARAEPAPVPSDVVAGTSAADAPVVPVAVAAPWRRPLALAGLAGLAVGVLVVLAAVVLTLVDAGLLVSAVVATLAVPVVGGLVATAALRVASQRRPGDARLETRGPIAVVAAVVLSAVVGLGLLAPSSEALSWQGYLLGGAPLEPVVGLLVALVAAALVAVVVVASVALVRPAARD